MGVHPLTPDGSLSVDVLLDYAIPFDELWSCADVIEVQGRTVRVSCKAHLLEAKLAIEAPRKHDLRDIEDLRELIHEDDTTS